MKNKIILILLTAAILLTASLCACEDSSQGTSAVYKVSVKDPLGKPCGNGIIVKFLKNGEQAALQSCDENGVASKEMEKGDYTIEIASTDTAKEYFYDTDITLSAEKTEAEVLISQKISAQPQTIVAQGNEYDAYEVLTGCTYVELDTTDRNYFLFIPKEDGNYRFSIADGANAELGYYGAPHFVQEINTAEIENNSFTISVSASMIGSGDSGTSVFVLGVDSKEDTTSCIIGIERIGDALKTIEDEPWTIYEATAELSKYTLPEGSEIKEFDLTASSDEYTLVLNEEDGFYHLDTKDGPLVLMRLAEDCDYIACFKTILDRSGVSRYFFDENGDLIKKESYSECLLEYIEFVDENEGVYPLTEDLKFIVQQRGEYVGWWNPDSESYLFVDENGYDLPDINTDIAWLLMCCYID